MTFTETSLLVKAIGRNTYLSNLFISRHSRHIQSKGKGSKVTDIITHLSYTLTQSSQYSREILRAGLTKPVLWLRKLQASVVMQLVQGCSVSSGARMQPHLLQTPVQGSSAHLPTSPPSCSKHCAQDTRLLEDTMGGQGGWGLQRTSYTASSLSS